jgi:hypothetical protein
VAANGERAARRLVLHGFVAREYIGSLGHELCAFDASSVVVARLARWE